MYAKIPTSLIGGCSDTLYLRFPVQNGWRLFLPDTRLPPECWHMGYQYLTYQAVTWASCPHLWSTAGLTARIDRKGILPVQSCRKFRLSPLHRPSTLEGNALVWILNLGNPQLRKCLERAFRKVSNLFERYFRRKSCLLSVRLFLVDTLSNRRFLTALPLHLSVELSLFKIEKLPKLEICARVPPILLCSTPEHAERDKKRNLHSHPGVALTCASALSLPGQYEANTEPQDTT